MPAVLQGGLDAGRNVSGQHRRAILGEMDVGGLLDPGPLRKRGGVEVVDHDAVFNHHFLGDLVVGDFVTRPAWRIEFSLRDRSG